MFSTSCFIISVSLFTKQLYIFAKNEAWISVILGFLISVFMTAMYVVLAKRFSGKSLVEFNDIVFGPVLGKVFSWMYVFHFITIICLLTNSIIGFVQGFLLPGTPVALLYIAFFMVCVFAVRKGTIMQFGALFAVISILIIVLNSLLLLDNFDVKNYLPVFALPLRNYLIGAHIVAMIPLGPTIVLLMFLPYMQKNVAFGKSIYIGLAIGVGVLLLVVVRDTAVLGSSTLLLTFPTFSAIRMIDVGDILTRMEIVYSSVVLMLTFFTVTVYFSAAITGVKQLLKFESDKYFVNITGALLVIYSTVAFSSSAENAKWLTIGAAEFYQVFFLIILPAVTIITAALRGFFKKPEMITT